MAPNRRFRLGFYVSFEGAPFWIFWGTYQTCLPGLPACLPALPAWPAAPIWKSPELWVTSLASRTRKPSHGTKKPSLTRHGHKRRDARCSRQGSWGHSNDICNGRRCHSLFNQAREVDANRPLFSPRNPKQSRPRVSQTTAVSEEARYPSRAAPKPT